MCGLAGIYWKKKAFTPSPPRTSTCVEGSSSDSLLSSLAKALSHRGPDDQGHVTFSHLSLVHTRLSIIDVQGGHQPLYDTPSVCLVGNGEIYNYIELKKDFPDYSYASGSDMEVVFPLYRRYGETYARFLRGMFALALYDQTQDRLLLSRDPFGIKPLYYVEDEERIAFASEIQALLKAGLVAPRLNRLKRDEILQLRYTTGTETPFEGVFRLHPGETLVFEKGNLKTRFVQDLLSDTLKAARTFPNNKKSSEKEALTALDQALRESLQIHLRSEVPYGLFLSGGVDSAVLLRLMQAYEPSPVNTFTIGFETSQVHDEREAAQALAQAVGAHHHALLFTEQDFWTMLPKVVACLDDLVVDQASLPTYKLAKEASRHVKVVLCGEGGDELFAGYRRYQKASWPQWIGGKLFRQKGVFKGLENLFRVPLDHWRQGIEALAHQGISQGGSRLQVAQGVDLRTWLANSLLLKLDRCLMAHGIEGRTPLLDPLVTAHSFALENRLKIRRGYGKWILRKWLEQHFPQARPFDKKRGFRVPVGEWILKERAQLARLLPLQEGLRELCAPDQLSDFLRTLTLDHEFPAWVLLVYALWHKQYIQGVSLSDETTLAFLEKN